MRCVNLAEWPTSDTESAIQLQDGFINSLGKAGFVIRKWTSKDTQLVERLPVHYREAANEMTIKSDEYFIKTLGIKWNPVPDHFSFAVKLSDQTPVTKRQILSEVTRLYDPLEWLSPTTIQLKSFIQLMWMDKVSWDQTISVTLQKHYGCLRRQLKELKDIKLSRRVLLAQTTEDLQLHVFCDASTTAYAAVEYMRQETSEGTTHIKMLTAKTRVAPIKCICVPRMELCAALLDRN